ncbi:AhpC/TSA family protein [Tumebacillus permanentifrigoris]|jgi:peroxiredoxin|nr:AhpC/TSA family protein [Tumebacillus permanentifrigoris]
MPKGATETTTLKVGDPAPDFTLKAHGNRTISLSDYRGKNVFIAFYPLDWTPV